MNNKNLNSTAVLGTIIAALVLITNAEKIFVFIKESKQVLNQYPESEKYVGEKQHMQYPDKGNYVDLENPESCHKVNIFKNVSAELKENNYGIENAVAEAVLLISAEICIHRSQEVVDEYIRTGESITGSHTKGYKLKGDKRIR